MHCNGPIKIEVTAPPPSPWVRSTMLRTATHCNALQRPAAHCNALQSTATHCNTLQHTAAHCSTLQHTATRCSTLQHTARYCTTLHHFATHDTAIHYTLQRTATHSFNIMFRYIGTTKRCTILGVRLFSDRYGVATIRRLLNVIGLFCKRALQKRRCSAKETYDFKEPTNRSHPMHI